MTAGSAGQREPGCPSNLDLDELLAGDLVGLPREPVVRGHVEQCASCEQRLAARRVDPLLAPDPQLLRPLLSQLATAHVRAGRRQMTGVVAALGVAAVATLVLWTHRPGSKEQSDGNRTKGTLALTVFVKRANPGGQPVIDQVTGEGALHTGDEMRFSVTAARPGFLAVFGLDEAPSVTTYVPAPGASRPAPVAATGPVTLPGSVIADQTAGAERIVAIVCPTETPPDELKRKAETALAAAGNHPENVSSLGSGCQEGSVLLHKPRR